MQNMLKSKIFWLVSAVSAVIILLVAVNAGRAYRAETDVLFIPRSDAAVRNISQIIANARQIPRSLSFYDKLQKLYPDIDDQTAGMNDASRKNFWNDKIKLISVDRSGVVRVIAFDKNRVQAQIISRQTAGDMIVMMSRYYDTRNDLNMRVIDEPIIYDANINRDWTWGIISILLGLAVGMFFYLIPGLIKMFGISAKPPSMTFRRPGLYSFLDKKAETREPEIKKKPILNVGLSSREADYIFEPQKKSGAPENLPVGSKFVMNALKREQAAQEEKKEKEMETGRIHEATPDEVKERLNKLLGGKF